MTSAVIEDISKFTDPSNMNVNVYFTGVAMLSASSVQGIQRLASVICELTVVPWNR